jgi:hypothetical protein
MAKKKSIKDLIQDLIDDVPTDKKSGPGRKEGSGSKPGRFNMRVSEHFRKKLAWLRGNELCNYYEMKDSEILEKMVDDVLLMQEVMHNKVFKP